MLCLSFPLGWRRVCCARRWPSRSRLRVTRWTACWRWTITLWRSSAAWQLSSASTTHPHAHRWSRTWSVQDIDININLILFIPVSCRCLNCPVYHSNTSVSRSFKENTCIKKRESDQCRLTCYVHWNIFLLTEFSLACAFESIDPTHLELLWIGRKSDSKNIFLIKIRYFISWIILDWQKKWLKTILSNQNIIFPIWNFLWFAEKVTQNILFSLKYYIWYLELSWIGRKSDS